MAESFTNGKPWVATKEDETKCWGGHRDSSRFRCHMCGHRFKAGDVVRFVFANFAASPYPGGNFFTCQACDGADVIERAGAIYKESKSRLWWLWARVEDARDV